MSSGPGAAPPEIDEKRLLDRLRANEEAAFAELMRAYGGRLLAVARRMLRSEEEATDAVQDAFLSAFRGLAAFEGDARLSTWLHRIVVNACLMKLRTRRRKPEEPIDELLPAFLEDGHQARPACAWREPSDERIAREQTRRLVRECIDRLPESHREVLVLRDVEELDTDETAALLGLTASAVKTRLHRARQALRTLLDPHLREAGEGPA